MTQPPPTKLATLILAAGQSRRMGQTKQLLTWHNNKTIIQHIIDELDQHTNAGLYIVLGSQHDEIQKSITHPSITWIINPDPDSSMITSIQLGLTAILQTSTITHTLLHPVDHPEIEHEVIKKLIEIAQPDRAIIPTYKDRGGHPALIPRSVIDVILKHSITDLDALGGLAGFWKANPHLIERRPFNDAPNLTLNINTPDQYKRVRFL